MPMQGGVLILELVMHMDDRLITLFKLQKRGNKLAIHRHAFNRFSCHVDHALIDIQVIFLNCSPTIGRKQ